MKNNNETREISDFQFEFYARNYEEYEKSSKFGSYMNDENYIRLTVILNSLRDMEKQLKKCHKPYLHNDLLHKTLILTREIGESLETIFTQGVILTDLRLGRILNTYIHATDFLKPSNKIKINYFIDQMQSSLLICYSNAIAIFAEYLKQSNWFNSIDEELIHHIKTLHFDRRNVIFQTITMEIENGVKNAPS